MKNSLGKSTSGLIKKCYLTCTPIVGYTLQLLFYEIFCKVHGLAKIGVAYPSVAPSGLQFMTHLHVRFLLPIFTLR
jgi:hypothetical protein